MKKVWIIILVAVVLLGLWVTGKYNSLVQGDESVKTAWSQVENVYQRRLDLIPNLVNVVKGAAAQESGVLVAVVNARANATKTTIDIKDAQALAQFQKSQGELSSALSRLLVVTENYPTLKSLESFRDLQAQLEGTENRIAVERKNYNDTVNVYNVLLRRFPMNLIAGIFGFSLAQQFQAEEEAQKAPVVDFTK
jgi:LemA protein